MDNLPDMGKLYIRQSADFNVLSIVLFQQIIRAYGKEMRDFNQHVNGWENVVIFPIRNGLFRDAQFCG